MSIPLKTIRAIKVTFFYDLRIKLSSTSQHPMSGDFYQIPISQFRGIEEDGVAENVKDL